jgi:hypothetical protein
MSDKEKVEAYISLYKQQMDRFGKTQDVEWKGNFGVWALLAGAIYLASGKEGASVPLSVAAPILLLVIVIHLGWLKSVHRSEEVDKRLWVQYRGKAIRLLQPVVTPDDGADWIERPWYREVFWLLLEVGMTAILSAALFAILYWRAGK